MMRPRGVAAAVVALVAGQACAADLLTLYRDAMVTDPVYQSARAQYAATAEKLPQARSSYLPQVNASGSVFQNYISRSGTPDLDFNTRSGAIVLSQPVFRLQNWIAIGEA